MGRNMTRLTTERRHNCSYEIMNVVNVIPSSPPPPHVSERLKGATVWKGLLRAYCPANTNASVLMLQLRLVCHNNYIK